MLVYDVLKVCSRNQFLRLYCVVGIHSYHDKDTEYPGYIIIRKRCIVFLGYSEYIANFALN